MKFFYRTFNDSTTSPTFSCASVSEGITQAKEDILNAFPNEEGFYNVFDEMGEIMALGERSIRTNFKWKEMTWI